MSLWLCSVYEKPKKITFVLFTLKTWNLAYLITALVILKTGPSRILRGPVKIQKEHHIELTIPKYQDITFITKFNKLQMAPEAESNFMM